MKKLSIILFASILAFTSCTKDEETEDAPIIGTTITISDDITEDVTWKTGNIYIIDGTVRVRNADITIEKGVVIKFNEHSALDVAYWDNEYSTIKANGTAAAPIIFTSSNPNPQAGDWKGIFFYKGSNNCEFNYCTFKYGGSYEYYGMIHIEEAAVSFENCTFKESASNGIKLATDGEFSSFTLNTMKDNDNHHIDIYPNFVSTIGLNNTYEGSLGILVNNNGDVDQKGNVTWNNQNTPYFIEGAIRIGALGEGVNFTIAPGTTLKFMEGAQFDINYWSDKYATFNAIGTAENPIIFTSSNPSPVKGDWDGLFFHTGVGTSRISHCEILYAAGYEYFGSLYLDDDINSLTLDNTRFADMKSHAIVVTNTTLDYSNNVTFENIDGDNYHSIY